MEIKISTYDFLNKFILGLVFTGVVVLSYGNEVRHYFEVYSAIKWNSIITTVFSVSALAIVYEVGILINRLGSILEDFLRLCHLIPFNKDYKKFDFKHSFKRICFIKKLCRIILTDFYCLFYSFCLVWINPNSNNVGLLLFMQEIFPKDSRSDEIGIKRYERQRATKRNT